MSVEAGLELSANIRLDDQHAKRQPSDNLVDNRIAEVWLYTS
jgi:hypothetical protein